MTEKLIKSFPQKGFLLIVCLLAFAPLLGAEVPSVTVQKNDAQYRATLQIILKRASNLIRQGNTAASILVLKNFRESLILTVEGGQLLLIQENSREARKRLQAAQEKYADNPLCLLLLGDLFDREGKEGEAIHYYLSFWNH